MLNLLAKIFGASRAVSIYVALQRFGIPAVLGVGFLAVLGTVMYVSQPRAHEHVAFVVADVTGRQPLGSDSMGIILDLRLPDGSALRLTETEQALANAVTDIACLELRRFTDTGEARYRIKQQNICMN